MAKRYNRIMLGRGGMYANQCRAEGFIGVDFLSDIDMTGRLSDSLQEFNKLYIPIWMECHPDKSKTAAGLACGNLWTVCKGLQIGDVVLSPNGKGEYYVGVIESDYSYAGEEVLPHRRIVKWLDKTISRIKTACNEPDFDTADRLFKTALVDAMTDIIIDVIPATELFQYIEETEGKSSQAI